MKLFIIRSLLFSLVALILFVGLITLSSVLVKRQGFENWQTESNTLMLKEEKHYDLLFTGISHARNFSRYENHLRMEKILGKSIVNIGKGYGTCGINEQYFYLKYFYNKGNSADVLVYFTTPPLMYNESLPVASSTFEDEALSLDFFYQYLNFPTENKKERLVEYLRSKLHPRWIFKRPDRHKENSQSMENVDTAAVKRGFAQAYGSKTNHSRYVKSAVQMEEVIKYAQKKNMKVIFIVTPAVFGKWPEHWEIIEFLEEMKSKYAIQYYDFAMTVLDPELYYDHHHLNTKGVIYFTETYLTDILGKKQQ